MYLKLIDEDISELSYYYDMPFYVYLSLTNLCNANCVFCEVRTNKEKKCAIDIKKTIDELADLGTKYIHFTGGGEPFVNDDIFEYLEYCTQKGIKIILISNGWNLDETKIQKLSNYNIQAMFFSIDSAMPEVHDSLRGIDGLWDKVTSNINLLKKYIPNIKIVLNHVLNKNNIDSFKQFIKLKQKYDFDYINPIVVKDYEPLFFTKQQIDHYNKNLRTYYKLAKELDVKFFANNINFFNAEVSKKGDRVTNNDLKCVYPAFCAFIDAPSGGVYPCDCSIHRDRTLYKLGDLRLQTFNEMWNSEKRKFLKEQLFNGHLRCKTKCDEANCQFNNKFLDYVKVR